MTARSHEYQYSSRQAEAANGSIDAERVMSIRDMLRDDGGR